MLLDVRLIRGKSRHVLETSRGTPKVSLLHEDHAQVVPRLDVLRFHFQDLAETRLGGGQVAVMVDVDVAQQNQSFAVMWMVLKPDASVPDYHSSDKLAEAGPNQRAKAHAMKNQHPAASRENPVSLPLLLQRDITRGKTQRSLRRQQQQQQRVAWRLIQMLQKYTVNYHNQHFYL